MEVRGTLQKPRWSLLFRSPLVWSINASSFTHNFVVVAFSAYLPFYFKSVHNASLASVSHSLLVL